VQYQAALVRLDQLREELQRRGGHLDGITVGQDGAAALAVAGQLALDGGDHVAYQGDLHHDQGIGRAARAADHRRLDLRFGARSGWPQVQSGKFRRTAELSDRPVRIP
jgi:hypothetical protein